MIFWLIAALMTVAALAMVLVPLVRSHRLAPRRVEFDLAIYRDQLHELESDRARDLVGEDQSEAARLEIQRRMLAASNKDSHQAPPAETAVSTRPWLMMAAIGIAIPALALVLYLVWGSPGMPDQPFSGVAQDGGGVAGEDMAGQSIEAVIANLAKRLEQDPNNLQDWVLLGRSLIAIERYAEAVQALRTAAKLSGDDPDIASSMAEAMVFAAGEMVTPEAQAAFESVLTLRADDAAAQYYLGMALAQKGRPAEALKMWRKLASETPSDAPWRQDLVTLMQRAAEESGVELGEIPAAPALVTESAAPGPSQEDMAAAADMTPEERQEMISSMIARLAERLKDEPDNLAGWQRLANAYRVLGENEKAEEAERRIAQLEGGLGGGSVAESGPSAKEMAAAREMSAEERTEMVATMVARLAEHLEKNPDDLQGWMRLGRSYSVLLRHTEARDAYARAAELAPDDTAVLGEYARAIMNAAGEVSEFPAPAIAVYRYIIELAPEDKEALWFLGYAEAASGSAAGAREYWTRLLELLPDAGPNREAVEQALQAL